MSKLGGAEIGGADEARLRIRRQRHYMIDSTF